ncbi:hypothetical protein H7J84_27485 [Mycobacterium goodii]|uniref:hypothetical protein n=1 Tax=Mycolicibacterium goodii TaxID=134601 RepID=UPI002265BCB5|nr:hypothetical protein [Mycolicibacterium goodii]MCV7296280.1 hypothetical protein [Mycolicibacterium goodii]
MDREASMWDVALAGIVSATGSLDDPAKAWQGVNSLRLQGNTYPLPIWWAAATWPDTVDQLVLPPVLTAPPRPGTVAAHAAACLSAAGLMEPDEASRWQRWASPLASFAADTVAGHVAHGTGELLVATAHQQLEDMAVKLSRLNAGVRVGAKPPEFSETYLLKVAGVAESLRYVSAGLGRAFDQIRTSLSADTTAFATKPTAQDIPADLRTTVNAEVHLGFVQAATKINLTQGV